ncbi:MAG: CotH kinase family protein [Eubacteriales bacterium]
MKKWIKSRKIVWILPLMLLFFLLSALCIVGYAGGEETVTLIESGVTEWSYRLLTPEEYAGYHSNWLQVGYTPTSNWKSGTSPFGDRVDPGNGSGWEGDYHVILLVTTFQIDDLNDARTREFVMNIFYDNTMTVYLNGRSVFYDERWVDQYVDLVMDDDFNDNLTEGTNTLAISLCDDAGGREFDMTLFMREKKPVQIEPLDPSLTVTAEQLAETGLSTIYINTENGDYVRSRLTYVDATMSIDLSDEYAAYENLYTLADGGEIQIKGRGNSTWNNGYPDGKANTLAGDTHTRKVPYTIKLDSKANLFGMGKSKHWVLIANYMDRTNLRNKLIYDLSGQMGMTFCKSVYVNLVFNGEYMGTYTLTQKIDPDLFEDQVTDWDDAAEEFAENVAKEKGYDKTWMANFEDQLTADFSWLTSETYQGYRVSDYVDLSKYPLYTGYLMEYDGYADEASFFQTNHGVPLKVSNMEAIKTNPELFSYIQTFFNDFEEACYSETFYNSKGKHYSEYVDMDSLVDYYILNTVILNVEFGYKSMYMYINDEGKIVLGPCWDYDWSSGNPFLGANGQYDQWYNDSRAENNKWYRKLYADPYFVSLVRERWFELTDALSDMVDSIDYYQSYLSKAAELEYAKFSADPYESDFAWRTGGRSFEAECNQLKTFLQNRIEWLNARFLNRDPNIEGRGLVSSDLITLGLSGKLSSDGSELFDYQLSDTTSPVQLSVTVSRNATAKIYLNGILIKEQNQTKGVTANLTVPASDLSPGVNVLTVQIYLSGELYGTNYLSLVKPGVKRAAPTAGDYTNGYTTGTVTPPPVTTPVTTTTTTKPVTTTKPTISPTTTPETPTNTTVPPVTALPSGAETTKSAPTTSEPQIPSDTSDDTTGQNPVLPSEILTTEPINKAPMTSGSENSSDASESPSDSGHLWWIVIVIVLILVVCAGTAGVWIGVKKKKTK